MKEPRAGGLRAHSPSGRHPRSRPQSPHTLRASGEIIAKSPPTLCAGAGTKAGHPHVRFGRVGKPQLSLHTLFVQVGRLKLVLYKLWANRGILPEPSTPHAPKPDPRRLHASGEAALEPLVLSEPKSGLHGHSPKGKPVLRSESIKTTLTATAYQPA